MSFKFRRVCAMAVVSLFVFGCASVGLGPRNVVGEIQSRGTLRVGMSGDQAPLNVTDRRGNLIGMEVDLAKAFAKSLGVQADLVKMPFGELLDALEAGDVDIVMSGMAMTPERNLRAAFVGPYFVSGKAVLSRSEAIASATGPEDIQSASLRLAALAGSTSQKFVEEALGQAQLTTTPTYEGAVQMVIDGRVDAMVADFPICLISVLKHPEAKLQTVVAPLTFEPIGVALPTDAPLLTNMLTNYLTLLEGSGILEALRIKWFEDATWLRELP